MERYWSKSNHTAEDCQHVVNQFIIYGHIHTFDWGCKADVHTSWAIVEAEESKIAGAVISSRALALKSPRHSIG